MLSNINLVPKRFAPPTRCLVVVFLLMTSLLLTAWGKFSHAQEKREMQVFTLHLRSETSTPRPGIDLEFRPATVKVLPETPQEEPLFEYVAKIVCGIQSEPNDMRLARGFYATTINIHNPNKEPAKFFKKLALTYPPKEQRPGEIHPISEDVLKYDEALKVDCNDVEQRLFPSGFPTPYIEGFVIIQSNQSLDVTAVYTTAVLDKKARVTEHSSIDVEQIRERRKGEKCLPDLVPVPDAAGSFCKRLNGNLVITVKNQGSCSAAASNTKIDFLSFGTVTLPTPALAPGAQVDLTVNIPAGCFNPDCEFRISVDDLSEVPESEEGNNTASDRCVG